MTTRQEAESYEDRRSIAGRAAHKSAGAAEDWQKHFLTFVKRLEGNWALSMALILGAFIVLSIL